MLRLCNDGSGKKSVDEKKHNEIGRPLLLEILEKMWTTGTGAPVAQLRSQHRERVRTLDYLEGTAYKLKTGA